MKTLLSLFGQIMKTGFGILGGWWTVIELLNYQSISVPQFIKTPWCVLCIAIALTSVYYLLPLFKVIHVKESDCELCVRPGNILKKKNATIVVGINDILSCDRTIIGENSIHYQLMQKKYSRQVEDRLNEARLSLNGQKAKYGTVFSVNAANYNKFFIFLVMSNISKPGIIDTKAEDLCRAITDLFKQESSLTIKNNKLFIPIIGTGPAGVGITKYNMIKAIACAYCLHRSRDGHNITRLTIKIRWKDYLNLDIVSIIRDLQWMAKNCCCISNGCEL